MSSSSEASVVSGAEKNAVIINDGKTGVTHNLEDAVQNVDPFNESSFTETDLEMIASHLDDRSFDEWLKLLTEYVRYHKDDVGISTEHLSLLDDILNGPIGDQSEAEWQTVVKFEAFLFHEWSIYPEVRAVTRPPVLEDDPEEEYQTFRAMASGTIWGAAGAVIATFFAPRYPPISLGSFSLQILIAITGFSLGRLPRIESPLGFGHRFILNTGKPWNYREQMLATLTMAVVDGSPYVQSTLIAQGNKYFYNFSEANSFGYIILLVLSSAFMGFGVGGLFRAAVIFPSRFVYYSVLPTLAVSRTLVQSDVRESVNGWKLKRWEFFAIASTILFGYYWITAILMGFLQFFTWICWIAPNNVDANAITGASSGLGLNPFPSFDPSIFGEFSGIATPLWAYTNIVVGAAISLIAICIVWYTNVSYTEYLPINSNSLFDNEGQFWQVSEVLDPKTLKLDEDMFQAYSFPYWSAGNVVLYGTNFMIYTAGFLAGYLNYGDDISTGFVAIFNGLKRSGIRKVRAIDLFNDPFSRQIQQYKEVPEWWFLVILFGSIGMAIGTVEHYEFTDTPVWSIFLGIGLAVVFFPIVFPLLARSSAIYETNVLYELIVGYALPGNGNVLLVGKAYATNFFSQADNWITNQKMAHYAGIAPRTLFWAQVISTVVTSFVQSGIITWQLGGGIHDMCNLKNKQLFRCQGTRTYFNASVMWGVIGPKRVFEAVYPKLKWCFLIGACYAIPFWVVRRFGPSAANRLNLRKGSWSHYLVSGLFLRYIDEQLILVGASSYFGSRNLTFLTVDYYTCIFFNWYIKKKFPQWWSKYAYVIVAAASNGIGWAGFFNFWATEYHHFVFVSWWGNNASDNTMDTNYTAVRKVVNATNGEYFGPKRGEFP